MSRSGISRRRVWANGLTDELGALVTRTQEWLSARSLQTALVLSLVAIGLVAHGLNLFHYPAFTYLDDEGIYAEQAWAILRMGRLSPYTYFYDHAPAGWILIAAWMALTGGPETFGGAIDSGRVLIVLLHLAMIPILYRLARRLGASIPWAALGALLFSTSPLAIFYQRLLLLDNIMVFWTLLSLELLLDGRGRLSRTVLSGVCYGLAVLSKETAIFIAPALLYIAVQQRCLHHGRFAVAGWLIPMMMVVSWYPLYAALKGELLPAGRALTFLLLNIETGSHVSLVESLQWQASRGGGGLLNLDNQFWQLMRGDWMQRDAVLIAGGAIASLANLILGARDRRVLCAGLLGMLPLIYLGRGGIVQNFYIIFAIPYFCLNIAILLSTLTRRVSNVVVVPLTIICAVSLTVWYSSSGRLEPLFRERPDQPGREVIAWIKQHLPEESRIVTRDDVLTDLREDGFGGPGFPDAHSHYKVGADPEIRDGVFWNDWRRVDYLIMSPGLESYFLELNDTVALDALANSHPVKQWTGDAGTLIELRKVDRAGSTEHALMRSSAALISRRFERDGAFLTADGDLFSESQAYAMLRSAWSDDRETFYRTWTWTRDQLMNEAGLLAWLWRDGRVVDSHSASDADTDAALALLLAGRRWEDPALIDAGRRMAQAIWTHEVAVVNGRPYLTAGDWAPAGETVVLNPSYFSPHAYQVFAQVDPEHAWYDLIDSSYDVLFASGEATLGASQSAGLPPNWVGVSRADGQLVPVSVNDADGTIYSYDAARTYWRVAVHSRWSDDGRARAYLQYADFLADEVQRKGNVSASYAHDGTVLEPHSSVVSQAGALGALLVARPEAAHALYADQMIGGVWRQAAGAGWSNPQDLYAQEWGWFAVALYANAVPNLWDAQ